MRQYPRNPRILTSTSLNDSRIIRPKRLLVGRSFFVKGIELAFSNRKEERIFFKPNVIILPASPIAKDN